MTHTKCNIPCEKYLNIIYNLDHRKALTKFRISAHALPIEIGRRNGIERHKRFCNLCPANIMGDEFHIVACCKNDEISELRNSVIQQLKILVPQIEMFSIKDAFFYLFSCCDLSTIGIIAPFIYKIRV